MAISTSCIPYYLEPVSSPCTMSRMCSRDGVIHGGCFVCVCVCDALIAFFSQIANFALFLYLREPGTGPSSLGRQRALHTYKIGGMQFFRLLSSTVNLFIVSLCFIVLTWIQIIRTSVVTLASCHPGIWSNINFNHKIRYRIKAELVIFLLHYSAGG